MKTLRIRQPWAWLRRIRSRMGLVLPPEADFDRGGIIGEAEIVDCVQEHPSPWFSGPYGFVLRNARPLPFRPLPGRLGFFEVDVDEG